MQLPHSLNHLTSIKCKAQYKVLSKTEAWPWELMVEWRCSELSTPTSQARAKHWGGRKGHPGEPGLDPHEPPPHATTSWIWAPAASSSPGNFPPPFLKTSLLPNPNHHPLTPRHPESMHQGLIAFSSLPILYPYYHAPAIQRARALNQGTLLVYYNIFPLLYFPLSGNLHSAC